MQSSYWSKTQTLPSFYIPAEANRIAEINRRNMKDPQLFPNYQINPYTKKTLTYVTPKPNERRSSCSKDPQDVPGFEDIRHSLWRGNAPTKLRYCQPQTELQTIGWWEGIDEEALAAIYEKPDERFRFSYQSSDFIKTKSAIQHYDRIFAALGVGASRFAKAPAPATPTAPMEQPQPAGEVKKDSKAQA